MKIRNFLQISLILLKTSTKFYDLFKNIIDYFWNAKIQGIFQMLSIVYGQIYFHIYYLIFICSKHMLQTYAYKKENKKRPGSRKSSFSKLVRKSSFSKLVRKSSISTLVGKSQKFKKSLKVNPKECTIYTKWTSTLANFLGVDSHMLNRSLKNRLNEFIFVFADFPLLYTAMAAGWPVLGPFSLLGKYRGEKSLSPG